MPGVNLTFSRVSARWTEAWPDALGFGAGLGLAWWFQWETRELVWSLWLSSLTVGYAMIVWTIFGAGRRSADGESRSWAELLIGGGFLLAFFTVHFGMFHFVHSVFLNAFFPVVGQSRGPSLGLYGEVVARYWWFVPLAFLAERHAFRADDDEEAQTGGKSRPLSRREAKSQQPAARIMRPYKNVIRLHVLIFFFAAAHFARLDNFFVYAVVYAVYFFPWRLVAKNPAVAK